MINYGSGPYNMSSFLNYTSNITYQHVITCGPSPHVIITIPMKPNPTSLCQENHLLLLQPSSINQNKEQSFNHNYDCIYLEKVMSFGFVIQINLLMVMKIRPTLPSI